MRNAIANVAVLLALTGCGSYHVQVVDESTGRPILDVRLRAHLADVMGAPIPGWTMTVGKTDHQGRAVYHYVKPLLHRMELNHKDYVGVGYEEGASQWDGRAATAFMRPRRQRQNADSTLQTVPDAAR
jgi:hypothetical protein